MTRRKNKDSITERVTGRLDRDELRYQSMAGGKGVYRGELATRALETVGARAMTLDRSIIVGDSFDPVKAEDQALFAHELYHAEHGDGGGGGTGDNFRDAEEIAARAAESLAFHRATAGGYESGNLPDTRGSGAESDKHRAIQEQAGKATQTNPDSSNKPPDAMSGYQALQSQGLSHEEIVIQLARQIVGSIQSEYETKGSRGGHLKGTL